LWGLCCVCSYAKMRVNCVGGEQCQWVARGCVVAKYVITIDQTLTEWLATQMSTHFSEEGSLNYRVLNCSVVDSSWNMIGHGDAREGK
jgi:hypothetical protein